jgi:putative ABC transport system substrate-binding protein
LQLTSRVLSVALAGVLSFFSSAHADPLRVHVVLSERGGAYQAFSDALRDELKTQSVTLSVGEPEENAGVSDLTIAVGMRSAGVLVANKKPVLNVFVPKAGYDNLPKPVATRHSSAIYLDQPLERQLSILVAALPKAKHIGVLYTVPPPGLANLRQLIAEKHLVLHEKVVGPEHDLVDALDGVLEESEALLVLPDTDVYNAGTIRNILLTSYRKQVPLIGISQAYVKAGALCAIYSTPAQIAAQTAEAVRQFAATAKLPATQYPKDFEVSVNMQVARSLDLPIKDAKILREEIRRNP